MDVRLVYTGNGVEDPKLLATDLPAFCSFDLAVLAIVVGRRRR